MFNITGRDCYCCYRPWDRHHYTCYTRLQLALYTFPHPLLIVEPLSVCVIHRRKAHESQNAKMSAKQFNQEMLFGSLLYAKFWQFSLVTWTRAPWKGIWDTCMDDFPSQLTTCDLQGQVCTGPKVVCFISCRQRKLSESLRDRTERT